MLELGPLSIHAYGLMIALGVVAAVWLTGRRLEARGAGTRDDASAHGHVGRHRRHHRRSAVPRDHRLELVRGRLLRIFQIWKGGLGIPGGLLAGIVVGWWVTKRRGVDPARDGHRCGAGDPAGAGDRSCAATGSTRSCSAAPTDLPWGLEIGDAKIPAGTRPARSFHPTFLYESLWNLALCGAAAS